MTIKPSESRRPGGSIDGKVKLSTSNWIAIVGLVMAQLLGALAVYVKQENRITTLEVQVAGLERLLIRLESKFP